MFLLFGYSLMLPALALASVPIIIHLLNKRKHKVVDWGAMQFLVASMSSRRRKMKAEELLLLILRTLLVLLLVMALARPLLPETVVADPQAMSDVVMVIDGGHSMQARVGKGTRFDDARERAKKLIDDTPRGHAIGLVLALDKPEVLVAPVSDASPETVKAELDKVKPYPCNMNMADAVAKAVDLLASGTHQVKKLIVISDGRRQGWSMDRFEVWKRIEAAVNRLPSAKRGEFNGLILTLDDAAGENAADEAAGLVIRKASTDRMVGLNRKVRVTVEVENVSSAEQNDWRLRMITDGDPESEVRATLDRMEAAPRLKPLREVVTAGGETLLGLVEGSDDEGLTLRLAEGGTERKLKRSEIKTPPRKPEKLLAFLDGKKNKLGAAETGARLELAVWAAAGDEKSWALARLAEVMKADPANKEAAKLDKLLRRGREVQTVRFEAERFTKPGSHLITVELIPPSKGGKELPGTDNRQRDDIAVNVVRTVPVLIVNGDPYEAGRHLSKTDDEAFYLRQALRPSWADTPAAAAGNKKPSPFEIIEPDVFSRGELDQAMRTAGTDGLAAFLRKKNYRAVVLANVDELSATEASALEGFVSTRGGRLILPGDKTKPASWNALPWLPATFAEGGGKVLGPEFTPPTNTRGLKVDMTKVKDSDLFSMLETSTALSDAGFHRWWRLSPRAGDTSVSVLMTLMNVRPVPLLIGRPLRKGRIVLSAVPGDRDWCNLPDGEHSIAYIVIMHELIYHLAGVSGESLRIRPGEEFLYAVPEGFDIDRAQAKVVLPKRTPEDTERRTAELLTRTVGERNYLVCGETREAGVYRMQVSGRDSTGRLAPADQVYQLEQDFVVDTRVESDEEPLGEDDRQMLARLLSGNVTEEVDKQVERLFTTDPAKARELVRQGSGPKSIWHIIAWGTVAFLVFEILLTRRVAARQGGAAGASVAFG